MTEPKRIVLSTAAVALALAVLPSLALAAPYGAKSAETSKAATMPMGAKHEMAMQHGRVVVKDAKAGTFTLECPGCSKDKVYTAPAGTKIASLAGQHVHLTLDDAGKVPAIRSNGAMHAEAAHHAKTKEN